MVGRPVSFAVDKDEAHPGKPMLEISNVVMLDENDDFALDHVSLTVRSGEVVGVAGVQGNGQTELVEAITGLEHVASGTIIFDGEDITRASVRDRHFRGMAHIPEDRHKSGMIGSFTIAENMVLNSYYLAPYSKGAAIDWGAVQKTSAKYCLDFDVRTPSVFLPAGNLSGGNQQKMVVARELERDTKLVIASQPTRGLDVGSIEYIHKRLIGSRDEGDGVLIVSSELDEIMGLADRIVVMFDGRLVAEFDNTGGKADRNAVGLAMAGAHEGAAA
jgi:general nucleoside transport system ATP-binding protein